MNLNFSMVSNFSESFSPKFMSMTTEPEPETEPKKVVKTPIHKMQIVDDSTIKEVANTLFEEVIKPQLTTAMSSTVEEYKERIDELEDRLSAFRRFMYAKELERSYEQWLTARIRSAKEEDNDEPLSISLQKGMKDIEIMCN